MFFFHNQNDGTLTGMPDAWLTLLLKQVAHDREQGDREAAEAGARVLKFFHEFSRDGSQNKKKNPPPPVPTVKKPVSILKPPRKYLPANAPVKKSTFYLELSPPMSRCASDSKEGKKCMKKFLAKFSATLSFCFPLLFTEPPLPPALNLQDPLPELSVEEELQETEEGSRNGDQFHSASSTMGATDLEEGEDPPSAFEFPAIAGAQSAMADAIRELQKNFGEKASQPTKFTRTNTGTPHKLKPKVNNTTSSDSAGKKWALMIQAMYFNVLISF